MKRTLLCATSCIKHYVHPSYGCCGTPVVACTCVYSVGKFSLYISYLITKKYRNKNVNSRDAAAKKKRYKRSSDK